MVSPGQLVGPYKLQGQLGAGGMGVVWVAEDTRLGRQVALKFLPVTSLGSDSALERFRLEARAASALSHPGICAIHDIGVHDAAPYIVMELLKGETLRDRIIRGPLRIADVLDIGIQLADALATAHGQGIVHRDIKPANIVVDEKQRPKLLDFGLAKLATGRYVSATPDDETMAGVPMGASGTPSPLTVAGTALGTVAYMSPEQARGEDVDARTDIFSLGVVLYEMVTGQQAFTGATTAVVFDAILNRAPVSPSVLKPDTPPRLVDAIHTALEKDRALRFQHAEELEAELKRIRRDLQSGATGATTRATTAATAAAASAFTPPPIPVAASITPPPIPIPAAVMPPAATPPSGTTAYTAMPLPDPPRPRRRRVGLAWVIVGLVFGLSSYCNSPSRRAGSARTDAADVSRAEQRLAAKDYRAALVEAEAVLQDDDEDDDALRVKREAEKQIAALDALAARVRTAAQSGDITEAARLLAEAQDLAPGDAVLTELSVLVRSATDAPPARSVASTPATKTATVAAPARPGAASTGSAAPPPGRPAEIGAPMPPPAPAPPGPGGPPPALTPRGDEPEVRRVLDVYRRAVAARDFDLFRTVFPGLTVEDEQRIRGSLGPGGPQPLMRVEQLTIDGDAAEARLVFFDPAPVRPRLSQTLELAKRDGAWSIVRLGPPRRRPRPPQ